MFLLLLTPIEEAADLRENFGGRVNFGCRCAAGELICWKGAIPPRLGGDDDFLAMQAAGWILIFRCHGGSESG